MDYAIMIIFTPLLSGCHFLMKYSDFNPLVHNLPVGSLKKTQVALPSLLHSFKSVGSLTSTRQKGRECTGPSKTHSLPLLPWLEATAKLQQQPTVFSSTLRRRTREGRRPRSLPASPRSTRPSRPSALGHHFLYYYKTCLVYSLPFLLPFLTWLDDLHPRRSWRGGEGHLCKKSLPS